MRGGLRTGRIAQDRANGSQSPQQNGAAQCCKAEPLAETPDRNSKAAQHRAARQNISPKRQTATAKWCSTMPPRRSKPMHRQMIRVPPNFNEREPKMPTIIKPAPLPDNVESFSAEEKERFDEICKELLLEKSEKTMTGNGGLPDAADDSVTRANASEPDKSSINAAPEPDDSGVCATAPKLDDSDVCATAPKHDDSGASDADADASGDGSPLIGTISERTLHAALKAFYEPDPRFREVRVGRFVADICRGGRVIEIQTRNFRALRRKLLAFSAERSVRVVYPIALTKQVSWIEPDTGEIASRRRSPRNGRPTDILRELYALRPVLPIEGLSLELVFVDVEEFRLLTGRSRDRKHYGVRRAERIPTALRGRLVLEDVSDYLKLLPRELGETFGTADFAKAARMTKLRAGECLRTLVTLGAVEVVGKNGHALSYSRAVGLTPSMEKDKG